MKRVIVYLSGLVLVLASCSGEPGVNNKLLETHTPLVQRIFYSDDSLFHGVSLGMKKDEVKKLLAPGDSVTEEDVDYLLVEGVFDEHKHYTWDCKFDSAGLYALTLDVYLMDEETGTEWYTDITSYFTDRFGPATDDGVALTWEVRNGKRPARIELVEEMGYGYGKLNVYYYDLSFMPLTDPNDTLPQDSFFLPTDNLQ